MNTTSKLLLDFQIDIFWIFCHSQTLLLVFEVPLAQLADNLHVRHPIPRLLRLP